MARTLARRHCGRRGCSLTRRRPYLHHAAGIGGYMGKRVGTVCAVTGIVAVVLLAWAGAAGADVVKPPAACVGSATWAKTKQHETTTAHATDDVVKIPQSGDVQWAANQSGYTLDL